MVVQFTLHAKERMDEHGIDEEQVKVAILRGSVSRQTEGYLASYTYFSVAFQRRGDVYRVKTVFLNR